MTKLRWFIDDVSFSSAVICFVSSVCLIASQGRGEFGLAMFFFTIVTVPIVAGRLLAGLLVHLVTTKLKEKAMSDSKLYLLRGTPTGEPLTLRDLARLVDEARSGGWDLSSRVRAVTRWRGTTREGSYVTQLAVSNGDRSTVLRADDVLDD